MGATTPDVDSRTTTHSPTTPTDFTSIVESETETITGAVAAGTVTVDELDRFVQRVERGEIDGQRGVGDVVRIVRALLTEDAPAWEEMEAASAATAV